MKKNEKTKKNNSERCREYYLKNKEKIQQKKREYYLQNKDKIKQRNKEWACKNREKSNSYKKKNKDKQKLVLKNIIKQHKIKCSHCNENDYSCLEFHHIDKKNKESLIPKLVSNAVNKNVLLKEIKKCEVLCSNCHRKYHFKHFRTKFFKAKYVYSIKSNSYCSICGESHWSCLDFHHVNQKDKILNIGAMIRDKKYTIQDIEDEIKKCLLICSNCHRKTHNNFR